MKIELATKERVINFRSFLIVAIFVLASVYCSLVMMSIMWLGILLLCLNLVVCGIFGIYFYNKRVKCGAFKYITFIISAVFVCFAFTSFVVTEQNWSKDFNDYAILEGMVESDNINNATRYITINKVSIDGVKVAGRVELSVKQSINEARLSVGTLILLEAYIENVDLVNGFDVNGTAFRNNIRYTAQAEKITDKEIVGSIYPGVMASLREAIYLRLLNSMGEENSAISYGMIVGDKSYISGEVLNYFTVSGLRHLLAVSGLHLSIVCGFLTMILLRLSIKRRNIAIVNVLAILFYVFLAGFSPSVLRSAFMSAVGVFFFLSGEERDMLNTLGFAFSIILAFAPFFLFEAGFILSVCAIFGLALFSTPLSTFLIEKVFRIKNMPSELKGKKALKGYNNPNDAKAKRRFYRKARIKRKILRLIGGTISVQLGIFPVCVYFFKSFQVYSIIVNIIVVPIVVFIFIATLLFLVFSFITTVSYPLTICGYGMSGLDFVAQFVAKLPYATILVYSTKLIFACYLLYFIMSGMVIKRKKLLISLLCVIQCVALVAMQNSPAIISNSLTPLNFSFSNVSMINVDGKNYVIGDFWSGSAISYKLKNLRIRLVSGVFVNNLNENIATQLLVFSDIYGGIDVYYPQDKSNKTSVDLLAKSKDINPIAFDRANSLMDTQTVELLNGFHALFENGEFCAYGFKKQDVSIIFVPFKMYYTSIKEIFKYNIVRVNRYYAPLKNTIFLVNEAQVDDKNIISAQKYDNYGFNFIFGEVYLPK